MATLSEAMHLRGLARGGALNLAGAGVASVTNVILILLVTRQVAPEIAGSLFATTSLFLIGATVARLGTTTGLVYWPARLAALGRGDQVGACLRIGLIPVGIAGVVMGAVMMAAADPLGRLVGGAEPGIAINYLRGLAVFLPLAALADAMLAATRGLGMMRATVLIDKVSRPLGQVAFTVVVLAVLTPSALAVAWAAPFSAAAVVAALWLAHMWRQRPPVSTAPTEPLPPFRPGQFWRYTGPRLGGNLVQLALQRLDIVLVAVLAGPVAAALYTAATRLLVVGQLGNQAISLAIQPRLAALLAVGDRAQAGRLYQVATGWLILTTWPLYLACLALPTLLLSLFGESYREGGQVVVILAGAMLLATACGMVDEVLNMAGKTVWPLINSSAALATMIALDLLLIPQLGVKGAAIGWAAAIAVNNLAPLCQLYVAFRIHPFGRETTRALATAAATLGVAPPALALAGAPVGTIVGALVLGVLAFCAFVFRARRTFALDTFGAALRRQPPALTDPEPAELGGVAGKTPPLPMAGR